MNSVIRVESLHFYLAGILDSSEDIPRDLQDKLRHEIVKIFQDLISKYNASGESLLLASAYVASKRLGIELEPIQINKIFGKQNLAWINLLRNVNIK